MPRFPVRDLPIVERVKEYDVRAEENCSICLEPNISVYPRVFEWGEAQNQPLVEMRCCSRSENSPNSVKYVHEYCLKTWAMSQLVSRTQQRHLGGLNPRSFSCPHCSQEIPQRHAAHLRMEPEKSLLEQLIESVAYFLYS